MVVTFEDSFFDVFTVPHNVSPHIKEYFEVEKGIKVDTDSENLLVDAINQNCGELYVLKGNMIVKDVPTAAPPAPYVSAAIPPVPDAPVVVPPAPTKISQATVNHIKDKFDHNYLSEYEAHVRHMARLSNLMRNRISSDSFIDSTNKALEIDGVNDITSNHDHILIHTDEIICVVESGSFNLGKMVFSIPFSLFNVGTGEILIRANSGDALPHTYTEVDENNYRKACFGSAMTAILDAISKVEIDVLASMLINFMKGGVDEKDELGENVLSFPEVQ